MMILKVKLKINRNNKVNRACFDLEKMKDPVIVELQGELAGKFAPLLLPDHDPQTLCDEPTNTMVKGVEEKLGKPTKSRNGGLH